MSKQFGDGERFAIIRTKEGYSLGFMDHNWDLREGQTFKVSIDLDGQTFSGQSTATSSTLMIIPNIGDEFIKQFANGKVVKFEVAGSVWTIVPANAASAIKAVSIAD